MDIVGYQDNSSQQVQNAHYQGGYTYQVNTNARLEDFSSWYHLVSITDTAAASSSASLTNEPEFPGSVTPGFVAEPEPYFVPYWLKNGMFIDL